MRTKLFYVNVNKMQGAVAVELALLLIPLIVMTFGVAEFGRAIYEYNTLVKTVRDSARLLSQHDANDTANYATHVAEARCLAVHGTVDCSGPRLLQGLDTSMVQTSTAKASGTSINLVTVTITGYTFNFLFNPLIFFGDADSSITFSPIHTTMRQL